jgi:hypothetical protein
VAFEYFINDVASATAGRRRRTNNVIDIQIPSGGARMAKL